MMIKKALLLSLTLIIILSMSTCKNIGSNILKFTLLQTTDLHSHAAGYGASLDYTPGINADNDGVLGGYTRLASLIAAIRNELEEDDIPSVLVDSGDFFMGTVYDLATVDPLVLKFFQMVGFDAVTLGNHEFDWTPSGLALLLSNGISNGFTVPVVATNMVTSDVSPADDAVEGLVNLGAIVPKTVLELPNGLRIGLLGNMGQAADARAPVALPVTFNHDYSFLQARVDDLRNNDGVDIVILLSHSGIKADGSGDDADIADNVTGIDIIASGHDHDAISTPFNRNGTLIFSPGKYGEWLSRLDVEFNTETGEIESTGYNLIAVNDTIRNRTVFETIVDGYRSAIDSALTPLGFTLDASVSRVGWDMETGGAYETGLGNLVADAIRAVGTSLAPLNDGNPFQVGIVGNGVIRDNLFTGKTGVVTFTDVYNVLPIGGSPDVTQPLPGYPMMGVYVTGPDLRNICEVGLTLSSIVGEDFYLNFSGIRVDYNPAQAATLQGVTAVYLSPVTDFITSVQGTAIDLTDTTTVYHVIVDLFHLQLLGVVADFGLIIVPRDVNGVPIPPNQLMLHRVDAQIAPGMQELKEWLALLVYLSNSFPASGSGIPAPVYGPGGVGMRRINAQQDSSLNKSFSGGPGGRLF
ncbi:MAG: bifunctional metallophosphatase/5'-nucleotidase, partial [bacterium]|nr:bifunctional metallophosphatase/5'-nucleotidase [bacterium]